MARVKRGTTVKARHKKVIKMASGYRGRSSRCYRMALQRVEKALQYVYRDRRCRKRDLRGLWIQRINAAARQHGLVYSDFIHGLKVLGLPFNRKLLADMAVNEPLSLEYLATQVKRVGPFRVATL